MRIGWIGFHLEGVAALRALVDSPYDFVGAITLTPAARSRRSAAVSYRVLLQDTAVPVYEVDSINEPETIALLEAMSLDVVFVIGWTQILRPEVLRTAERGMVGAHASLLPHYRGSAPVNWAIINGQRSTGNSLIWLSESVDCGDIIDQVSIPITEYDTCATLYDKVARSNREMILRLLPRLETGERPGRKQAASHQRLLPRRRPHDGLIDWGLDARSVYDFIRALTRPYPGSFSYLNGSCWRIWACALGPFRSSGPVRPGAVLGPVVSPVEEACGQAVVCGDRQALVLLEVEGPDAKLLRGPELSDQAWDGAFSTSE